MTPWEFGAAVDGATERRYYEQETVARMTANLINVHLDKGKRVRPEDLFRRPDAPPEFHDAKSFRAYRKQRKASAE